MKLSLSVLATAALALAAPTNKDKRANKLQFFGVNESGPEFGEGTLPGAYGKEYIWPTLSTIDTFMSQGMNTFRINTLMERMVPNQMTGSFDQGYMKNLTETVNYITNKGAYAMIVPHNYGRYYGNVFTDANAFKTFWKNTAAVYKSNSKVIFDTNNEFHDEAGSNVAAMNQAAIDGIRAAGATSQYIMVEGNAWTGAWTWTTTKGTDGKTNAETMGSLKDPQNKIIYQVSCHRPPASVLGPGSTDDSDATDAPVSRHGWQRHARAMRQQHDRLRAPASRDAVAAQQREEGPHRRVRRRRQPDLPGCGQGYAGFHWEEH